MTNDDDFHDQAALASLTGRLENCNLNHADSVKLARAAYKDADAMLDEKQKAEALSFTAMEALRSKGGRER